MSARPALIAAILLLPGLATAGCGGDGTGPATRLYQVSAVETDTQTLADGSVRHIYQVTVTDGNLLVAGAWMRFSVTAGDVSPQTDRTDGEGHGRVEWTLEAEDRSGITSATLSGCAQNTAPPDCTPQPLASLTF